MNSARIAVSALSLVAMGAGVPAVATGAGPADTAIYAAAYDDEELRSFAAAVLHVKRITDQYLPRVVVADTPLEREQVEAAASAEMAQAVATEGFTVARFNEILSEARANPQLAQRIREHLSAR